MLNEEQWAARISQEASVLTALCQAGLELSKVLENRIAADALRQRQYSRAVHDEAIASLNEDRKRSLTTALAKLQVPDIPSQLEWGSPSLQVYSDKSNGGIGTTLLRLGTFVVNVRGRRVRIPLNLEVLNRCNLVISWDVGCRAQAVSILQSILLRTLLTIVPGKLLLRCFDAADHGRAFSTFLQRLPSTITGGSAGVNNHQFDALVTELEQRMAIVAQKLLNDANPTLWDYNNSTTGELEPYFIVALDNSGDLDKDRVQRMLRIVKNGPRHGIFTILTSSSVESIRKIQGGQEALQSTLSINVTNTGLQLEQSGVRLSREVELDSFPDGTLADDIITSVDNVYKQISDESVPFLLSPTDKWSTGDCLSGIDIPVGRTKAGNDLRLIFNEEALTGALVVGSSGQGKSNLLHVIISRLMLTYPPTRLHLYLLDLKGTEFPLYAAIRPPHVKMLLSDMSQKLGLTILREFEGELSRRKRLLSAQQKQKLSEYNQIPGAQYLPRVVIVIDEFHKLFANDQTLAREAETIITNILRQGRSYGVHLIMASQNLSPQTTPRDIKTMFPIKIVLKFSSPSDYANVLEESADLSSILTKRGQAVHHSGTGASIWFNIPHLPFSTLEPILHQLSELLASRGETSSDAVFLNGEEGSDVRKNTSLLNIVARGGIDKDISLWLGDAFSLKGSASVTLRRQKSSNLFVACQDRHLDLALHLTCVAILAFIAQSPTNRCTVFSCKNVPIENPLQLIITAFPDRLRIAAEDDANAIHELADAIKGTPSTGREETVLLVFPGLHKYDALGTDIQNLYSRPVVRTPTTVRSTADSLLTILDKGPTAGFHSMVLHESPSRLERATLGHFNLRVAFRLTDADSMSLFQAKDAEALPDGLAVLVDRAESSKSQEFRPYTNIDHKWLDTQIATIKFREHTQV